MADHMVVIREIQDTDYAAAAAFVHAHAQASAPMPSVDDWRRHDDQRRALQAPLHRWVAVDPINQHIVGYGHCWPVRFPQCRMDLLVHPQWRCQGIGSQLLSTIVDALTAINARTLQARTREDATAALEFLHRRQFREIHRMVELRLDLTQTDVAAFASACARLSAQGIAVVTLADEERNDPACWQKLTALHNAALPDWPQPDPGPVEELRPEALHQLLSGWNVIPEAFFLAKRDQHYIGYSGLARSPETPDLVESGGTAVRPDERNRGLATALKMVCLSYAIHHGYTTAATRSASAAMIRVNEKLGFQRGLSEVRLVRTVQSPQHEVAQGCWE